MAVADLFLRSKPKLQTTDLWLHVAGAEGGALPPITATVLLASTATLTAGEALADGAALASTATLATGEAVAVEVLIGGWAWLAADVSVAGVPVEAPVGGVVVQSPVFDVGSVVDLVALTSANEWAWAHERPVQWPGNPRHTVAAVRPAQVPVQSAVAGADGLVVFAAVPPGRYWVIGEERGVVRRVARRVP